jgi:cytochrome c oxidase cbb3-type subunit 3
MSEREIVPELELSAAPERDGIDEEDNPIPTWFNVGFYGLIAFGIVYAAFYLGSGWSSVGQYAAELEEAELRYAAIRAELPGANPYRGDPAAMAGGKEVFDTICMACHKADGSGFVGPSLVDPYWKFGSSDPDLFASVSAGRPMGMPGWGPQLGTEKIWKALAYLETLPRSDAPGVGSPEYEAAKASAPSPGG